MQIRDFVALDALKIYYFAHIQSVMEYGIFGCAKNISEAKESDSDYVEVTFFNLVQAVFELFSC